MALVSVLTKSMEAFLRVQMRLLLVESVHVVSDATTSAPQVEGEPSLAPHSIEPVLSSTIATSRPVVFLVCAVTDTLMLLIPINGINTIGTVACARYLTVVAAKSAVDGTGATVTPVPQAV